MKSDNKKENQITKTFDTYEAQLMTLYPNELIDFLGGVEPLKKINIYGHRIIFVMMEMLKAAQVHKMSIDEAKEIISNDMVINEGRFDSLQYLKAEQIEKRRKLESGKKLAVIDESYFVENFSMLQMVIPTMALNDNGNIKVKDNSVFHNQLKILKSLGNHTIKSNDGGEVLITNFIETPIFNKGQNYIRFYISKPTAKMLLNNIDGYSKVYRSILFGTSSTMPLNVYLYLKKKFGKTNGGTLKIKKFIADLALADYYNRKSKLTTFLDSIKNKLNEVGNISFGYKIEEDNIVFQLYETRNTVLVEYASNDEYKAQNALKYIRKTRKLDDKQMVYIDAKFKEHTYDKMSSLTTIKLSKKIIGMDYLKWFVDKCNELQL